MRTKLGASQNIPLQFFLHTANKLVVNLLVHVDPLNRAATLARVKHRSIDQVLRDILDIYIGAHIGGVITTEFQVYRLDLLGSCFPKPDTASS